MPRRPPPRKSGRRFERAFVVRLWQEDGLGAPGSMRGSIVELDGDRRFFFTELGDLKDFLALRVVALERDEQ
jgi:hypothetical protein